MRAYEHRQIVGFEDTNLVGNVYYANHIRWQGRCREMFLRQHAPDVIEMIHNGLALITVHCSCDYVSELVAFDEVLIRMYLDRVVQNRVAMLFEYWRVGEEEELIARGRHEIACMQRVGDKTVATPVPTSMREALEMYAR